MPLIEPGSSDTCNLFSLFLQKVPFLLAIKITSVRGTMRIQIKPPPCDRIWYGFTSMPEIEWELESSFGDRKIANSHIAAFISKIIKVSHLLSCSDYRVICWVLCLNPTTCPIPYRLHSIKAWYCRIVKAFPCHGWYRRRMIGCLAKLHLLYGWIVNPARL